MANQLEPVLVKANQKVVIEIEENPDIIIYLWNEEGRELEIEHINNQMNVPASKGEYIYEVLAEWTNGINSYPFVLEIE